MRMPDLTDEVIQGIELPNLPQVATVYPNEKCWQITEFEALTNDYRDRHRWQHIVVVRDGEHKAGLVDVGSALAWPGVPALRFISMGEDTVAECIESVEGMRAENMENSAVVKKILAERGPSTLIDDATRYYDQSWKLSHNQSVFGPGYKKERNLFARRRQKYGRNA